MALSPPLKPPSLLHQIPCLLQIDTHTHMRTHTQIQQRAVNAAVHSHLHEPCCVGRDAPLEPQQADDVSDAVLSLHEFTHCHTCVCWLLTPVVTDGAHHVGGLAHLWIQQAHHTRLIQARGESKVGWKLHPAETRQCRPWHWGSSHFIAEPIRPAESSLLHHAVALPEYNSTPQSQPSSLLPPQDILL